MPTRYPKPPIVRRKSWNAQPGGGTKYPGHLSKTYYRVTAHHDAHPIAATADLATALKIVRKHQRTHFGLGWSDVGYHYFIAPSGHIIEGRPLNTQGAHVEYENYGNVGICVMGELHLRSATDAQKKSFDKLFSWLVHYLDLDPNSLKGHCDYMPTQCPGSFIEHLPKAVMAAKETLEPGYIPNETTDPRPSLQVHGKDIGELVIIDGVSYAPVRSLANSLGFAVRWDAETKTVTVEDAKAP